MNWETVVLADVSQEAHLLPAIDELFELERRTWEAFRDGQQALQNHRTKRLGEADDYILVQANERRRASTHANVDPQAIAQRPCFLCPQNIPPQERGLAWDQFIILPNPFPIVQRHCTIPAREHRPQQLLGNALAMLRLAQGLGEQMVVFYNGPRCGASAPDHLHFQACEAAQVPLWNQIDWSVDGETHRMSQRFGRGFLFAQDADPLQLQAWIQRAVEALGDLAHQADPPPTSPHAPEPLLNLLVGYDQGRYRCLLFPRAAHRPQAYFLPEPQRLAVSPATLEMAGLLVVAEPEHFQRIDEAAARQIYTEVTLDRQCCAQLAVRLGLETEAE